MTRLIAAHWRGECSLARSYWLNGLALSAGLGLLGGWWLAARGVELRPAAAAPLVALALALAVVAWQTVGLWRSATRAAREPGRAFWPRAAKATCVLGALTGGLNLLSAAGDLLRLEGVTGSRELSEYRLERKAGGGLLLTGAINRRSAREAVAALGDPAAGPLWVDSPGGLVEPALDLARHVRAHGVTVVASGRCMSACVLLLAASPRAAVEPGALVVFHRFEPAAAPANPVLREQDALTLRRVADLYREAGLAGWAVAAADRERSWMPSLGEQVGMGLVKQVYDRGRGAFVAAAGYCAEHGRACGR